MSENNSKSLPEHVVKGINYIWQDDLKDLRGKLDCYLKEEISCTCSDTHDLLVGLWINNYENNIGRNPTYWNVYGNLIDSINTRLVNQAIYLKPDKRSENLVSIPKDYKNIFKKSLQNIHYITKDQEQILCAGPHVFVNGPAGAGKTLLLYARVLKLLECSGHTEQIFVLLPWDHHAHILKRTVEKFDNTVVTRIIDLVTTVILQNGCPTLFEEMMKSCVEKIIIFIRPNFIMYRKIHQGVPPDKLKVLHNIFLDTLQSRTSSHIFCDDFQNSISHSICHRICNQQSDCGGWTHPLPRDDIVPLANFLLQLFVQQSELPRMLWIGCDVMQTIQYRFWGTEILINEVCSYLVALKNNEELLKQSFLLDANMRNSFNIGMLMKNIRDKFLETMDHSRESLLTILPHQHLSHFIHGPMPLLYCVFEKDPYLMTIPKILQQEVTWMFLSLQASSAEKMDKKLAVIPLYHHPSYVLDAKAPGNGNGSEKMFWDFRDKVIEMTVIDGVDPEYVCANNVKYFNSLEFLSAILVLDLSNLELDGLVDTDQDEKLALVNILAHLYAAISRAKVCLSIILISADSNPSGLFSEIRNILQPYAKTIEVYNQ